MHAAPLRFADEARGYHCSESACPKLFIHLSAQANDDFWKRLDVLQASAKIHDAEAQRELAA